MRKIGENTLIRKNTTYGERLYHIWRGIKDRCLCVTSPHYENYGKRGISVCAEWRDDFPAFVEWSIKNGYKSNLSIDRIDNDDDYCPNNCRWVDRKTQNRNTRKNHYWEYNGETHTLPEWAEILGISRGVLKDRLYKLGWSIEQAFNTPVLNKWNNMKGRGNSDNSMRYKAEKKSS